MLDYKTDEIINKIVTDDKGKAEYYPMILSQKIYCIAIAPDYSLYVSSPIIFNDDYTENNGMYIELTKEYDEYTSGFYIVINDSNELSITDSNIRIISTLKGNELKSSYDYGFETDKDGYVTYLNHVLYFNLNTRYSLNISLDGYDEPKSIDGSLTNTNLVSIYFDHNTIEE